MCYQDGKDCCQYGNIFLPPTEFFTFPHTGKAFCTLEGDRVSPQGPAFSGMGECKRSHSRDRKTFLGWGNGKKPYGWREKCSCIDMSMSSGKTSNNKDNIIMQGRQQTIGPTTAGPTIAEKHLSLYCGCYSGLPRLRWLTVYCIELLPSHCCCGFCC